MGVLSPGAMARLTAWPVVLLAAGVLVGYHLWMVGAETVHPLTNALDAYAGGILVLPVVAGGACVAAHRLAGGGAFQRPRSAGRQAGQSVIAVLPAAIAGATTLGVGALAQMARAGHVAGIPLWLVATMLLAPLAAALCGALFGRVLPLFIALPIALTVVYLAVGAFSSMDNGPLRLMMAPPVSCCVSQTEPAGGASLGQVMALSGLVLALAAVWCAAGLRRASLLTALAMAAGAAGTWIAGWQAAAGAPDHGLTLRAPSGGCEAVADTGRAGPSVVSLCLWPENEPRRQAIAEQLARLADVARRHDLPFPGEVTEYAGTSGRVVALDGSEDQHWRGSLLFSVAEAPRCGHDQVLPGSGDEAVAGPQDAEARMALDAASVEWWEVQLGRRPALSGEVARLLGDDLEEQQQTLREHLAEPAC
ncbi:hypothetical protein [Kytococcus sedentarius]|uniref:hypothetical protein n=1 Tax=Kytococcus sedentarius TaxID=1276 RepID=UPI003850C09B